MNLPNIPKKLVKYFVFLSMGVLLVCHEKSLACMGAKCSFEPFKQLQVLPLLRLEMMMKSRVCHQNKLG